MIVIVSDLVDDCWLGTVESCTLNTVGLVFVVVGVPVIAPDALTESPVGSAEPLSMLNMYPRVPPDAASCPE